jgi:RHS repeat-associated protein
VKANDDGTEEETFYGYNPHTDIETLTDRTGNTKATYGYTAYGKNDDARFTGVDKPDAADPTKEPYNPYRFNAKRWDQASSTYDMGFRDYSPGLNRFTTRDTYNGALADMNLGLNPFTMNRYAFAGGNPTTRVELDGHVADLGGGGGRGGDFDDLCASTGGTHPACDPTRASSSCSAHPVCSREGPVASGSTSGSRRSAAQPEISESVINQALDEAHQLLLEGGGVGFCAEGGYSFFVTGHSGSACLVKVGDEYGLVGFLGGDWGYLKGIGAHATAQMVYTSAGSLEDLRGPSACFTAAAGSGPAGSAGICISFSDESFKDVSSVSVVVGVGVGLGMPDTGVLPGPNGIAELQTGYTIATELPTVESAVEGSVNWLDETTGWSDFLEDIRSPFGFFH